MKYSYLYLMKYPVLNLIITVFLFWLTIQIGKSSEEYLSYFFILTIGIMHGSNDISLIRVLRTNSSPNSNYLSLYIVLIIFNIVAFFILPFLALISFVFVSCYHFGEQHYHHLIKKRTINSMLFFLSYGALIFGLLFYNNFTATSAIINELTNVAIEQKYYLYFLLLGIGATIITTILNRKNFTSDFNYFQELFLILLFTLLFQLASLLWAFAIYFVVWHSLPSLIDQIKVLYGNSSKINLINYIRSSFVYWLISILGLVILYFSTQYFAINFITLFFAFLAAITVPHVIVMYFLNKN
ncbi:Brp/Blh family beta-carotene 15,15'-dioxygenase [Winogradskyella sp.]